MPPKIFIKIPFTFLSDNIILNGHGTEKIYEILKIKFPNATIARVDSDTLKSRNNLSSILKDFSNGDIDILIGTGITEYT